MKRSFIRFCLAGCTLLLPPLAMDCKAYSNGSDSGRSGSAQAKPGKEGADSPAAPRTARATNAPAGQKNDAATGGAAGKHGPVILGERFTTRRLVDAQQGGLPLGVFSVPEKWRDRGQVNWNYGWVSNPASASFSVENPDNEEALYSFPSLRFYYLRPEYGFSRYGQNDLGLIHAQSVPPLQALLGFIRRWRGNYPRFQVVGSKDLPELPAALRVPQARELRGIGIKVTYELNGHGVGEEFYAVPYSVDIPYDGPQGRTWQVNWGLDYLHSFRAPLGTLDRRRPVFTAIAKSFRLNPAWQQRYTAITAYLQDQFNRQLQAGYDQIAAAGALSRQISANNDAMLAAIDRQLVASRTSLSGGSGARSAADKFDDYIQGVDTVDDPYYGTSQHAYTEQYHWTDGYGNYRNSNAASYNPNQTENGDWQLMPLTR